MRGLKLVVGFPGEVLLNKPSLSVTTKLILSGLQGDDSNQNPSLIFQRSSVLPTRRILRTFTNTKEILMPNSIVLACHFAECNPPSNLARFISCAVLAGLAALPAQAQNVYTQHNDSARTGANLSETILTPANVNSASFGKLYTVNVDGQVFAQPLYVSGLAIPGKGSHNVVYVATMRNSIYALDADNSGSQIWKSSFGTPVYPPDVEYASNITRGSSVGILSTPVIDRSTNTIYFVSRNESGTGSSGKFSQYLNALDISTGSPKFGSPHLIQASYSTADNTLTFDPKIHNQRAALTLANGKIYVAWASHDDIGAYHGWVISFNPSTLVQQDVYVDTTTGTRGGIWQAGQGLATDASGNLLLSTGNGSVGASPKGVIQTGNSFVKLSSSLTLLDWFSPYNSGTLNSQDNDLGSSGLLPIPGTNYAAGGGKQGVLYLVDTTNMGHYNTSRDNVRQEFRAVYGNGSSHIHGTPIYFNSAANGPCVYLWGENDYLRAFQFSASSGLLQTSPFATSTMTAPMTNANGAMPGGFLSISANGNTNGIVWASTPYSGNAQQATVQGVLHAFDATNLHEIWSDKDNVARDEIGNFAKTSPPTVVNGKLFMATFGAGGSPDGSGQLVVYGLLNPTTLIPDGDYVITSVNSGLVLDVPGASTQSDIVLDQAVATGQTQQSWHVTNLGGNVVTVANNASRELMDVRGASTSNSALVIQYPANGGRNQQWQVAQVGAGVYTLASVNSGQLLDVTGASKSPGASLNQYPANGNANQRWKITLK